MNAETRQFFNKKVLVIGASLGGIGSAIAEGFKTAGADVIITGVEDAPIKSLEKEFEYFKLDVTDQLHFDNLSRAIDSLDVLVNCAGVSDRGMERSISVFETILDINLTGTYRCCQSFFPKLQSSQGCIINIGSMYGILGSPKVPAYGAAKSGVHQLTKSLAIEWAEYGVRVNAIAPGFIDTPGTKLGRSDPKHYDAVANRTPLGRWGNSKDIVGPALFLASVDAAFITGVTLNVDGGYSAV
jgi:NAD(P)-dependent dehydrogenase (short-subunit alcohol dehydrogenase family)